jgi:hypothetical protein
VNIGGNLLAVSLPVESLSTLHRMIAVALMTGIAYLLCGILAFMSLHRSFSGLLLRPLPLLLGTAAAVVPLIPIPSLTRLVLWLLCCGAIAWMFRDSVAALVSIKRDRTGADGMD